MPVAQAEGKFTAGGAFAGMGRSEYHAPSGIERDEGGCVLMGQNDIFEVESGRDGDSECIDIQAQADSGRDIGIEADPLDGAYLDAAGFIPGHAQT